MKCKRHVSGRVSTPFLVSFLHFCSCLSSPNFRTNSFDSKLHRSTGVRSRLGSRSFAQPVEYDKPRTAQQCKQSAGTRETRDFALYSRTKRTRTERTENKLERQRVHNAGSSGKDIPRILRKPTDLRQVPQRAKQQARRIYNNHGATRTNHCDTHKPVAKRADCLSELHERAPLPAGTAFGVRAALTAPPRL